MMDKKRQITLLVTGSIAAKKAPEFVRALRLNNYDVKVLFTHAVEKYKLASCDDVKAASGYRVLTDADNLIDGPNLAAKKKALYSPDMILVAPASADIISQLANKSSTLARAILTAHGDKSLLVIAPAMNNWMWGHPAVRQDCDILKKSGVVFLGPVKGRMACGDEGFGRLIDPEELAAGVQAALDGKHLHFTYSYYETAREEGKNPAPLRPREENAPVLVALGGGNIKWPDVKALVGEINRAGLAANYVLDPTWKNHDEDLKNLTGRIVVSDHYQIDPKGMEHIRLPEEAACVFIPSLDDALATAMTQGRADTLFLTMCLATKVPVVTTEACLKNISPALASILRQNGLRTVESVGELPHFCAPSRSGASLQF